GRNLGSWQFPLVHSCHAEARSGAEATVHSATSAPPREFKFADPIGGPSAAAALSHTTVPRLETPKLVLSALAATAAEAQLCRVERAPLQRRELFFLLGIEQADRFGIAFRVQLAQLGKHFLPAATAAAQTLCLACI